MSVHRQAAVSPHHAVSFMIDNRILEELPTPLRPEHFHAAVHGRVYEDRKSVV